MKKYLPGILFVLPSVVLFCIFTIYPTFASISLGFFRAEIRYREFIGLGNFAYLIRNEEFWIAIWNTLKYIAFGVPPIVLIPLGISILAYRLSKPIQSFIRFAFYLPHLAAGVVISIVWRWIFNPLYGLANYLLELAGAEPLLWLADPTWAFVAICIVLISSGIGVNLLLYMASLASIPKEYWDAAKIDGCRQIQITWYITVPMIMPVVGFVFIKQVIAVSQIYQNILMMTGGGPYMATTSIVYLVYKEAFVAGRYGRAAAESMVLLLMVLTISIVQAKYFFWRKK